MSADHDELWDALRDRYADLEPGTELVTPHSDRPFRVLECSTDWLGIRFDDSGEERLLRREQFEVLVDRLDDRRLPVADLPPGVEPYVTVLTLLAEYCVEDDEIVHVPDPEMGGGSPYVRSPAEARERHERLHDDALLLADELESLDSADVELLETNALADLYVLLSDVQHRADRFRQTVRESLLARLGPDQELHGRFGTIRRTTRERRLPKDDEAVFEALDEHGIPREWVLGVDTDKLDVVLAVTDLDEADVFDVEEHDYVQKTEVEEAEKYSRLRGLADRIDELDGADAEELREDLRDLETRLDEALSA